MAAIRTTPTGGALRRARELAELSVGGAARRLGVSASTLRAWESGRAEPDEFQLDAAIALYGSDLYSIWPDRTPLVTDEDPETLVVGDERIDLRVDAFGLRPDNRTVLVRYLAAVRRQRGVRVDANVELRGADLMALSAVLDLDDRSLEATLTELLDLTPAGSRFTLRALAVGSLMAIGAGAIVGASWLAPNTGDAAAAPSQDTAVTVPVEISDEAAVLFAPGTGPDELQAGGAAGVSDTAGLSSSTDASRPAAPRSPFSTEPRAQAELVEAELTPAVFAVAPATEWTEIEAPFSVDPPEGAPGIIEPTQALGTPSPAELPPGSST